MVIFYHNAEAQAAIQKHTKTNKIAALYTVHAFNFYTICALSSGGYSNLGARGKNFQKLMLSEKKKRSDLGLHIFLPKSRCSPKKKRSSLRFHL